MTSFRYLKDSRYKTDYTKKHENLSLYEMFNLNIYFFISHH